MKFPSLSAMSALTGAEIIPGTQGGVDKRTTALDIAKLTTGKTALRVQAREMSPSASGGCAALATIATSANHPDVQSLDFDPTTEEYAQFSISMPKRWDLGTITWRPRWSHAATVTNFKTAWALQALAVSDGDAIDAAFGTAVQVNDTGGVTNDLYVGPESSAVTIAGTPAAGDTVFFRVYRVAADGTNDTLTIDARLHGIDLFITTNAVNDA
jgi:hypothetical protein